MKNELKPGHGKAVYISGLEGAIPTEKISLRPDLNILFSGPRKLEIFYTKWKKNGRKPPAYMEQVSVIRFSICRVCRKTHWIYFSGGGELIYLP